MTDDIDRTDYVNSESVQVIEHADTSAGQVAYGATCEEHGDLMNGDWHDHATAVQAVQQHLDTHHVLTVVEAMQTIRFLARTWLAPDASDPADIDEAEAKADAAFAALDRFDIEAVSEFITAQDDHFEQWVEDWRTCANCGEPGVHDKDEWGICLR